jgi:sec-independent protein translocase protein TatA
MLDSITGIVIVGIVIGVLFGFKKLPELMHNVGKATGEFQKGKFEAQRELDEIKKPIDDTTKNIKETVKETTK